MSEFTNELTREKQRIREEVWNKLEKEGVSKDTFGRIPTFAGEEKATKLLKGMEIYKIANKVFVPPDRAQYVVRLNVLLDDKSLIMATPGLKDGFYEVGYTTVPEWQWKDAITSSKIAKYGKKLRTSYEDIGKIDLMVTGAVAVSRQGERIGKGTGFFDWEYKILREINCVDETTPIVAIVHPLQIYDKLPFGERDVSIDYIVTSEEIIEIKNPPPRPKSIDWEYAKKLINEMRPLKELYSSKKAIVNFYRT